ncbi:TPA: hypothetical protein HA335_03500 [Methanocaldococcus jannaschii]|nr:hypothetical protein [Methanocaldococcus jannaschii]HII59636.1 hypothetical protein [Methanocaldococcus jannaschii]
MVNEHKAHLSVIQKMILAVVNGSITIILSIIVFYIFYPQNISLFLITAGILTVFVFLYGLLLFLFGFTHRELSYLSKYDKYKFLCKFTIEMFSSLTNHAFLTISAIVLYQIQHPKPTIDFIVMIGMITISVIVVMLLFLKTYSIIIKQLKKLENN